MILNVLDQLSIIQKQLGNGHFINAIQKVFLFITKNSNKYLKIFANAVPVKGVSRSVICDLHKKSYLLIPNSLYEMIKDFDDNSIADLYEKYGIGNEMYLDEYFDFLLSKELAFLIEKEERDMFPALSTEWDYPSLISNVIIDIGDWADLLFEDVVKQLEYLPCFNVQIRCYEEKDIDFWSRLLQMFETTRINTIELIVKYNETLSQESLENLLRSNPRIHNIQVHSNTEESFEIL